jgi:adenylate cyclase class 2
LRQQEVDGNKQFFLTFKGAKEKSSFKMRQEIEIEVDDADSVQKFLSALGYKSALSVEKKRKLWRLGGCEVALDHLDLLGDFVEIEGPDEGKIAAVQKDLGLAELPHIQKSYASLIKSKMNEDSRERLM